MVTGSPVKVAKDTDLVFLDEGEIGSNINDGTRRAMLARFPDIEELEGNLAILAINTKMESERGTQKTNERLIMRIELKETRVEEWSQVVPLASGRR